MILTREQVVQYWKTRLNETRVNWSHHKIAVRCVLHDDSHPSATVFLDGNSGFNCNGCGRKGNLFQHEALFSKCDLNQAEQNVADLTGAKPRVSNGWRQVAVFDYRDVDGRVVFQKRRLEHETEGKRFLAYHWTGERFEIGIDPEDGPATKRLLYGLPALITANVVCVAEGEVKVDLLDSLELYPDHPELRVSATCNFDGAWKPEQAPKWAPEYNPFFAGKFVLIFEDNDEPGREWSQHVAASVNPFAAGVKIVRLPGLGEKEDIADWMPEHSVDELRAVIKSAPRWRPGKSETISSIFVSGVEFLTARDEEIEWWVEGVVQKGSNGLVVADPGAGKSFLVSDLCVSLALGIPWMGKKVSGPIRVGLCAREDNPALTRWRLRHILSGKRGDLGLFEKNLWLNTRRESAELVLNDETQVQSLISAIRERELQLVFLDVFSKLHTINENKSEEMGPLVATLTRIQSESGAALCIVHHKNKQREGTITQRTRGSSVLNGWAEWILGIQMSDSELKTRTLSFEKIKAGEEGRSIDFRIDSTSHPGVVEMKLCQTAVVDTRVDYRSRAAGDAA